MGLLDLLKARKIKGIIGYLGLEKFWLSLTYEECQALIRYDRSGLGSSSQSSPIEGEFYNPHMTKLAYLHTQISWAVTDHNYTLADKIIEYCDSIFEASKPVDKHFYLMAAGDCYYKQRDIRQGALELAEQYYMKDVLLFPKYKRPLIKDIGMMPRIPSFQQLAIIYEKTGRYQEAIDICKQALHYGLKDNTKSGFNGRIEKIQKKMKQ